MQQNDPHRYVYEQQLLQKEGQRDALKKRLSDTEMQRSIVGRELKKAKDDLEGEEANLRGLESRFSHDKEGTDRANELSGEREEARKATGAEIDRLKEEIKQLESALEEKKRLLTNMEAHMHELSGDIQTKGNEHVVELERGQLMRAREHIEHTRREVAEREKEEHQLSVTQKQLEAEIARIGKEIKKLEIDLGR